MQSTLSNSINLIGFIFAAYVYSNILADDEAASEQFVSLLQGPEDLIIRYGFRGRF